MNASRKSRAFSLVELLVVVAIIGILAVLAVSAFSGKKAVDLSGAGQTVNSTAGLARQYALSRNTRMALVLGQVTVDGQPRSAISIWEADSTNQVEKWSLLPTAVVATNNSGYTAETLGGVNFRGQPVADASFYWFYPDGRMGNDPSQVPKLKLLPRQGDQANYYELVFSPLVGTAKVTRP